MINDHVPKGKIYLRDGRAPVPDNEFTSKAMSANRGSNTGPELGLRKALRAVGLSGYRLHWKKAPGHPDIAFPGKKIAIFVHGDFWHHCPTCNLPIPKTHHDFWKSKLERNVQRDKEKIDALEKDGWKVIVCWEHEIKNNALGCAKKIKEIVGPINGFEDM